MLMKTCLRVPQDRRACREHVTFGNVALAGLKGCSAPQSACLHSTLVQTPDPKALLAGNHQGNASTAAFHMQRHQRVVAQQEAHGKTLCSTRPDKA